ncbi:MAG TPA: sigma-54 dependent transcriptional regulator [Planctomycetota bacterium]
MEASDMSRTEGLAAGSAVGRSGSAARVEPAARTPEEVLLGSDPLMNAARSALRRGAAGILPVLILGETGTGKELAARWLHALSPRRAERFSVIHCAALPESLLESELFGHEKGAFTGAVTARAGRFEHADGGTVFLDEIGELPPQVQVKLLRVIEYGEVFRIGSNAPLFVDVRTIAATHRDLGALLAQGRFREDLFHRLNGTSVLLPPLREHPGDIETLAAYFLLLYARARAEAPRALTAEAVELLRRHPWPGNVRELRNVLWRAAEAAEAELLTADDLRRALTLPGSGPSRAPVVDDEGCRLRDALEAERWNVTRAARRLGISRSWLHRLMRRHRLDA